MPPEHFVELGIEAFNFLNERHWSRTYDAVSRRLSKKRIFRTPTGQITEKTAPPPPPSTSGGKRRKRSHPPPTSRDSIAAWSQEQVQRTITSKPNIYDRDDHLDRQTETSEEVLRAYPSEATDPIRQPENTFPNQNLDEPFDTDAQHNSNMSYANGGLAPQYQQQGQQGGQRANSAQPPRSRYYDDDDDYEDDYDDRRGGRNSRGYDDGYDQGGRGYDHEVIETERYKGPVRDADQRRQSFRSNDPYGPGAVTQYSRRNTQDDDYYNSRRSRSRGSRGRRDRSDSRDRSYSRSRSDSRGGGERSIQQKVGQHFDGSLQGIGVGIAGAVVGGMAGRHFGERNPRHKNRDILIGAIVGGLASNAAETKWRDWMDEKKDKVREDEEKWEQRWDGNQGGRSRSAMR